VEAKVASEPEALVCFFKELSFPVNRIGFEAGPLSQWLHAGLTQAGFEIALLDAACESGIVGDDREDGPQGCVWACTALRMRWFQPVQAKSIGSHEGC
jgi:transposase